MYVETVPNRTSPPAILLRKAVREGKKVRKVTLANLSHWPPQRIEALRRLLKGHTLVSPEELFAIDSSTPHGHVEAALFTLRALGVETMLSSRRCRERDLVVAMLVEQVIRPCSKLATTRLWHTTTLAEELSVADGTEGELYEALDWLLARQGRMEKKLAKRHLGEGSLVLYDVTTSYYEGRTCSLAQFGHDRDKKGKRVIVYGVLTDAQGRPMSVEVYAGNTGDPATVPDQVEKLRERFGLSRVVLVGDRGMLTQTRIEQLKRYPGVGWVSALRAPSIRKLVESGDLQLSLFDQQNLAEISSPAYPDERLVVCRNPLLAEERRRKRQELLEATEKELERIGKEVARRTRTPLLRDEIGVKVGRHINRFKMGKHFKYRIEDGRFTWERDEESIAREAALDGIYVLRTSEPEERLSAADTVRSYKGLSRVERLFRTLKGIDLRVRPIRHRTEDHVRGHIFLCVLAYYVEWHMRQAWKSLLFEDEELEEDHKRRDPVARATPSASAKAKKADRVTSDGFPVQSFKTLLEELGKHSRNVCRMKSDPSGSTFIRHTELSPLQRRAFELLKTAYPVASN